LLGGDDGSVGKLLKGESVRRHPERTSRM
jgi:hypothetical protein